MVSVREDVVRALGGQDGHWEFLPESAPHALPRRPRTLSMADRREEGVSRGRTRPAPWR